MYNAKYSKKYKSIKTAIPFFEQFIRYIIIKLIRVVIIRFQYRKLIIIRQCNQSKCIRFSVCLYDAFTNFKTFSDSKFSRLLRICAESLYVTQKYVL